MSNGKVLPIVLTYNTPELAYDRRLDLGDSCFIIENGGHVKYCDVWLGERLPWAKAWNTLMEQNRKYIEEYEYVWMLNSDVMGLSVDMAEELYTIAQMGGMNTGVITPAFNSPHSVFHRRGSGQGEYWPREVNWIDWTCPLVKLAAWDKVGGFDTEHFTDYGADVDISIRMKHEGYSLWVYETTNEVYHMGSVTAKKEGILWDAQRMQDGLVKKYGRPFETLV